MTHTRRPVKHPALTAAANEIAATDNVEIDVVRKSKTLLKFGRHPSLGTTRALIWSHGPDHGTETLLASNGITSIISSSAADTGKTVRIEYHTISGNNLTFGVQTATLNGQTAVTLPTACARISRMNNSGTTNIAGNVYTYEGGATTAGVPNDLTKVHARIRGADTPSLQQTEKAATSISANDYWIITQATGHLLGSNTARVRLTLERKSTTGVWLPTGITIGLGNNGNTQAGGIIDPPIIIPANHDVRMMGTSSAASTNVAAYFNGYLATIVT